MARRPLDLALVGAGGYWAGRILPNLSGLKGVRLRTLVSRRERPELLESLPPGAGVAVTHRFDRVLTGGGVDAVIIATSSATHYPLALAAIEAGKHVFLEKPPALAARQARALAAAAARAGVVVVVDHIYNFAEPVRIMDRMIRDGAVGRPLHFFSVRSNFGLFRTDSDALSDLGYHDIYVMRRLLQGPRPLSGSCATTCSFLRGHANTCAIHIRFAGGVTADVFLSWLSPTKERRVVVAGSEGILDFRDDRRLFFHDKSVTLRDRGFLPRDGATREIPLRGSDNPLRAALEHFAACVRGGAAPGPCSLAEAAETVRWQEKLRKSALSGRAARF